MRVLSLDRPVTAHDAVRLKSHYGEQAAFIAGGSIVQSGWQDSLASVNLIDIAGLPEAQGVQENATHLRIGAAMRLEPLRHHALVKKHAPLLAEACAGIGALGVRNLATLGGNIGWRFGDTLAVLLALDVDVELADGSVMPLMDILDMQSLPLIVAVQVALQTSAFSLYEKVGLRAAFSPTRLALALCVGQRRDEIFPVRIAATGAALQARRLRHAEAALQGHVPGTLPSSAIRAACLQDLPEDAQRARLAANLIAGHLGQFAGAST
jgi:CO/xanthine dehydrogenase FAD-binding subunit